MIIGTVVSNNFGKGKVNTDTMIAKWNKGIVENGGYGEQDDKDIWKYIQTQANNGWFIPSRDEWAAFGNELKVTKDNYKINYGLNGISYWSSSLQRLDNVWYAKFNQSESYIHNHGIGASLYVRLATTF